MSTIVLRSSIGFYVRDLLTEGGTNAQRQTGWATVVFAPSDTGTERTLRQRRVLSQCLTNSKLILILKQLINYIEVLPMVQTNMESEKSYGICILYKNRDTFIFENFAFFLITTVKQHA